jgi:hypothetical protein
VKNPKNAGGECVKKLNKVFETAYVYEREYMTISSDKNAWIEKL